MWRIRPNAREHGHGAKVAVGELHLLVSSLLTTNVRGGSDSQQSSPFVNVSLKRLCAT